MKPRELSEAQVAALPEKEQRKARFARSLHRAMRAKELTQAELARRLEIGEDHLSKWINGHSVPQQANLQHLADTLGVELYDLLPESAPPPPFMVAPSPTNPNKAKLSVNMEVPMDVAIQVMQLLNEAQKTLGVSAPQRARG